MKLLIKLTLILLLPFIAMKFLLPNDLSSAEGSGQLAQQMAQIKSLFTIGKAALANKDTLSSLEQLTQGTDQSAEQAIEQSAPATEKQEEEVFYRWKDKHGLWHFSQAPPQNGAYTTMKVGKGNVLPATKTEKPSTEISSETNAENKTAETTPSFISGLVSLLKQAKQAQDAGKQHTEALQKQE